MRKRMMGKKLSRASSTRRALMRSLTRALIISGKIETTHAKAKFVQKFVEKILSAARDNSIASRRRILADMANDRETVDALFGSIKLDARSSGFTRIINLKSRKGDSAPMARIEIIDWKKPEAEAGSKEKNKESGKKPTKEEKQEKKK